MLAILGILCVAPILLFIGAAALALLVSGCSGCEDTKEEVKDAAPPPPPPPPDPFAKEEGYPNVEPDSFEAVETLWSKEEIKKANLENWHRKTRMFIGTADQLYRSTVVGDKAPEIYKETKDYREAVTDFFEDHYKEAADKTEDGMLVLMAGLAPEKMDEKSIYGAFKAMGVKIEYLGEGGPNQETEYIELLKAVYHFNKAVEKADKRFSKPNGLRLKKDDKDDAKEEIKKAEKILEKFADMKPSDLNEALTDDQQELLEFLIGALADYKKTLGGGGYRRPPPSPQPQPTTRPAKIPGE